MTALTPEAARDLAGRLDTIPEADFATWKGDDAAGGVVSLPHPVYHPIAEEWRRATEGFGVPSPSQAYGRILDKSLPAISLDSIATAELELLFGYATYILRGERFSDGHIQGCHAKGFLSAVLRRYAELAEGRR